MELDLTGNIVDKTDYEIITNQTNHYPVLHKGDLINENQFPEFHLKDTGIKFSDGIYVENTDYKAVLYPFRPDENKEKNFICFLVTN